MSYIGLMTMASHTIQRRKIVEIFFENGCSVKYVYRKLRYINDQHLKVLLNKLLKVIHGGSMSRKIFIWFEEVL